eukprot:5295550-Prymnesium_polylepis.2
MADARISSARRTSRVSGRSGSVGGHVVTSAPTLLTVRGHTRANGGGNVVTHIYSRSFLAQRPGKIYSILA